MWFDQSYILFQYCSVLGMPATTSDSMPQWSSPRRILKKPGRTPRAKIKKATLSLHRPAKGTGLGAGIPGSSHRSPPSRCSRSWPPASTECCSPRPSPGCGWRGLPPAPQTRAGRPLQGKNTPKCQQALLAHTAECSQPGGHLVSQPPEQLRRGFWLNV